MGKVHFSLTIASDGSGMKVSNCEVLDYASALEIAKYLSFQWSSRRQFSVFNSMVFEKISSQGNLAVAKRNIYLVYCQAHILE